MEYFVTAGKQSEYNPFHVTNLFKRSTPSNWRGTNYSTKSNMVLMKKIHWQTPFLCYSFMSQIFTIPRGIMNSCTGYFYSTQLFWHFRVLNTNFALRIRAFCLMSVSLLMAKISIFPNFGVLHDSELSGIHSFSTSMILFLPLLNILTVTPMTVPST